MARYNVEYNGKWACFSSIVDAFITEFIDKDKYESWRKEQYGICNYEPVEKCNLMTIQDAVSNIRLNKSHDKAIECLLECGLSKSECEQMISDLEIKNYFPHLKNGIYTCPNCGKEINKNQKICDNEYCGLEFIWNNK